MNDFQLHDNTPLCSALMDHVAQALGFPPVASLVILLEIDGAQGPVIRYDLPRDPEPDWVDALIRNAEAALAEILVPETRLRLLFCPLLPQEELERNEAAVHCDRVQMCMGVAQALHERLGPVSAVHLVPLARSGDEGRTGESCWVDSPSSAIAAAAVRSDLLEAVGPATAAELGSEAEALFHPQRGAGTEMPPRGPDEFRLLCHVLLAWCSSGREVPPEVAGSICADLCREGNTEELLLMLLEEESPCLDRDCAERLHFNVLKWAVLREAVAEGEQYDPLIHRLRSLAAWLYWFRGGASKAISCLQMWELGGSPEGDPLGLAVRRLGDSGVVSRFARKKPTV